MKLIKFRAWDSITSQMFYGQHDGLAMPRLIGKDFSVRIQNQTGNRDQWRDLALMQFTGLRDRKGRDIYEGDIIQRYPKHKYSPFPVEFSTDEGWGLAQHMEVDVEVIGNIYDPQQTLEEISDAN